MSDDNNKGGPATLPPAFKGGQITTDGRTANRAEQGGACTLAGGERPATTKLKQPKLNRAGLSQHQPKKDGLCFHDTV